MEWVGWEGILKFQPLSTDTFYQTRWLPALSSLLLKRSLFLRAAAILDAELSGSSWDRAHTNFSFSEPQWDPIYPCIYNTQVKFLRLIMDASFIFTAEWTLPSYTQSDIWMELGCEVRRCGSEPHFSALLWPGTLPCLPHAHPTSHRSPADSQQLQSRRGYFLDDVRDLFFTAAGFGSLFRYSNCLSWAISVRNSSLPYTYTHSDT